MTRWDLWSLRLEMREHYFGMLRISFQVRSGYACTILYPTGRSLARQVAVDAARLFREGYKAPLWREALAKVPAEPVPA